ncbi:hypothetical protein PspLS_02270 [Pyricularia sp. CBS 133598]|nr:hypothetical protein PspLS_02270 [Pyricularia sp. CBS 133598]
MASRGVSVLKFVGTVSLGLLTGLSYTLGTVSAPALLALNSSENAAPAFYSLSASARRQLGALTAASATTFALALVASPRYFRHPYLLYTSVLAVLSAGAASERFNPYLRTAPRPLPRSNPDQAARRERAARARMEASYEVLSTDVHSDGTSSDELPEEEPVNLNGETVRADVETFIKKQMVRAGVAGVGFLVAVLGIWGDGAVRPPVYRF